LADSGDFVDIVFSFTRMGAGAVVVPVMSLSVVAARPGRAGEIAGISRTRVSEAGSGAEPTSRWSRPVVQGCASEVRPGRPHVPDPVGDRLSTRPAVAAGPVNLAIHPV
jgi:hypothetical protein